MEHLAIDLGGRKSQVCVRSPDGTIALEKVVETKLLPEFLKTRPHSRVVLETCAEALKVADAALAAGHEVRVVPATLGRQLGVGARGVKTDRRDAQALSGASCRVDLPSVHIRSQIARDRLTRLGMRSSLVKARTMLINTVRGWLRTELVRLVGVGATFPRKVREAALESAAGLPSYVEEVLKAIETLNAQIDEANAELLALAQQDEVCRRLMTVPGVGPVISMSFVAVVDDIVRFPNAKLLESYIGLTPGEKSSSQRRRLTGITKAGPATLRQVLVEASHSIRRTRPLEPICRWAEEVKKRRGKQIAAVATARKLAGIMYAMWRDGTAYSPTAGAQLPALASEGEAA